ncbi:MAG: hypothetical protein ACRCY9_22005 [Phycicoccus sp.]
MSAAAVADLLPRPIPAGLILGATGASTELPWLSPRRPVRVVILGPQALGHHVVVRALGAGAAVHIRSDRPETWAQLVSLVDLPRDRLAIVPPSGPTNLDPPGVRPVVVVDDTATSSESRSEPITGDAEPTGWRCDVALVSEAHTDSRRATSTRHADVVLLERTTASLGAVHEALDGAHATALEQAGPSPADDDGGVLLAGPATWVAMVSATTAQWWRLPVTLLGND